MKWFVLAKYGQLCYLVLSTWPGVEKEAKLVKINSDSMNGWEGKVLD
jgi:hypothetical protein